MSLPHNSQPGGLGGMRRNPIMPVLASNQFRHPENKKGRTKERPAKNHQRRMCSRLRRSKDACCTVAILAKNLEQTHYFSLFFGKKTTF
ncbi:MAG: hypothetical protein P9E88_06660 [Candidatus Competibacter sp.]|nr:hypothetical protein [Candidatus Competibacter sp.]